MLPVAVDRSFSGGIAICYVLPVLWMTSCFHTTEQRKSFDILALYKSDYYYYYYKWARIGLRNESTLPAAVPEAKPAICDASCLLTKLIN